MDQFLLHIETATTNCSVALSNNGELISFRESNEASFKHSDFLHLFISETMEAANLTFDQLAGVGVSMGPGSYTGLRIGVSTAKGICYAQEIPLIAVNSLMVLAQQCKGKENDFLIPMFDARRMEVFSMVLSANHKEIVPTRAQIISENSATDFPQGRKLLMGSGVEKCIPFLKGEEFVYRNEIKVPSAKDMIGLVTEKFLNLAFEDVAYFEPYYLKDFYTNPPKAK